MLVRFDRLSVLESTETCLSMYVEEKLEESELGSCDDEGAAESPARGKNNEDEGVGAA